MLASLRAQVLAVRKRPAVWVLVTLWLVLTLAFGYLFNYLSYRNGDTVGPGSALGLDPLLPSHLVSTMVSGMPLFGGAVALILGVLLTGSDYGWGTVKTLFTQGPRRLAVLAGTLGTLVGLVLALVVVTLALGAVCSLVIATIESAPVDWPSAVTLLRGVGAGWLILGVWALLGALLGTLVRGTALAVGLGLVWALVLENLIRGVGQTLEFFQQLATALPGGNAGSLAHALGAVAQGRTGAPGVVDLVGGERAALVLGLYLLAFLAITAALVHRRDIA